MKNDGSVFLPETDLGEKVPTRVDSCVDAKFSIPLMRPKVVDPSLSLTRMRDVAKSGFFSNFGPQVLELEDRFAATLGIPPNQVVTASNATVALTGAMVTGQVESWDIPAWTFAATAHAAIATKTPFRFVDVQPDTWEIRMDLVRNGNTGKVLVLPFGLPLAELSWGDEAEVVVDAAASFGSMWDQFPRLPLRTAVVFSLHATKVLGVGEGAIVVFGDPERARAFRSWTNFGFAGSRDSVLQGTNGKMSEYVGALLHSELDNWSRSLVEWKRARSLVEEISTELDLPLQPNSTGVIGPYWIAYLPSRESRDQIERNLAEAGIATRRWWGAGLHRMPAFAHVQFTNLEATNLIASRYVGLPFFRDLNKEHLNHIKMAIKKSL